MDHDPTDSPKMPASRMARRGTEPASQEPDLPPQEVATGDIDPATPSAEEEDEARLPEALEDNEAVAEGRLAVGHTAIENAVRLAPTSPGVYRMLNTASDVLYVGKAKNVRKRLQARVAWLAPCDIGKGIVEINPDLILQLVVHR